MSIVNNSELFIRVMKEIRKKTVMGALGIELIAIDDQGVTLKMPITDSVRQPLGNLHGGVNMVLAETAASIHATWGVDLSEVVPVGIEINGSHLRSASEGNVIAKSRVLQKSHHFVVHQIDITHVETGVRLCTARVTNFYKQTNKNLFEEHLRDLQLEES